MAFRWNLNDTDSEDCCRCPCCGLYHSGWAAIPPSDVAHECGDPLEGGHCWTIAEVWDEYWDTDYGTFTVITEPPPASGQGIIRCAGDEDLPDEFRATLHQEAITSSYAITAQIHLESGSSVRFYIQSDTYVEVSRTGDDYTIKMIDDETTVTPLVLYSYSVYLPSFGYYESGIGTMPNPEYQDTDTIIATITVYGEDDNRRVMYGYYTIADVWAINHEFIWDFPIVPTDNKIGIGGSGTADFYSYKLESIERCSCNETTKCETCQDSVMPRYLNVTFAGWQDSEAYCLCNCFDETFSIPRTSRCGYLLEIVNMIWNTWYRLSASITKVVDNYILSITMSWRSGGPIPWYTMATWEHDFGTDKPDCKAINVSDFELTYDNLTPELGCDPSGVSLTVVASETENPDYDSQRCWKCDDCGKSHPTQYQVVIAGMTQWGDGLDPPGFDWNGTYNLDRVSQNIYNDCIWKYTFPTATCGGYSHELTFYLTGNVCTGVGQATLSYNQVGYSLGNTFHEHITVPIACDTNTFNLAPTMSSGEYKVGCVFNDYSHKNGWDLAAATCVVTAV